VIAVGLISALDRARDGEDTRSAKQSALISGAQ